MEQARDQGNQVLQLTTVQPVQIDRLGIAGRPLAQEAEVQVLSVPVARGVVPQEDLQVDLPDAHRQADQVQEEVTNWIL